jgi:hypothetical protein
MWDSNELSRGAWEAESHESQRFVRFSDSVEGQPTPERAREAVQRHFCSLDETAREGRGPDRVFLLTCRFVCEGESKGEGDDDDWYERSAANRVAALMKIVIHRSEGRRYNQRYCYNPNEENVSEQRDGEDEQAYKRRKDGRWMQMWLSLLLYAVREPVGQEEGQVPGFVIQLRQTGCQPGLSYMQVAEEHLARSQGMRVETLEYGPDDDDSMLRQKVGDFVARHIGGENGPPPAERAMLASSQRKSTSLYAKMMQTTCQDFSLGSCGMCLNCGRLQAKHH